MAAVNSQEWASQSLRQMVIHQIEDTYGNFGNPTRKTSQEVEKHILDRAQSRDDYLQMVARLILHIKEVRGSQINRKDANVLGAMVANTGTNSTQLQGNINAMQNQLQNAASLRNAQSNLRAQLPASNMVPPLSQTISQPMQVTLQDGRIIDRSNVSNKMLLQTIQGGALPSLKQQQLAVQIQKQQNLQQNPTFSMSQPLQANQLSQQSMVTGIMMSSAPTTTSMSTSSQVFPTSQQQPQQLQPSQTQQLAPQNQQQQQRQTNDQMLMKRIQKRQQQQLQQLNQQLQQQQQNNGQDVSQGFTIPSTKTSSVQQQQQVTPSQPSSAQSKQQIKQASPAKTLPAPSPQPQQPSPSPMQPTPSPAYINPPSVGPSPSPLNQAEEQIYVEKLKEMTKYVEPLTKLIVNMPKDEEHKRERDKMNALLDMLTNKNRRVKLTVLNKCESVLTRLFPDIGSGDVIPTPDTNIVDSIPTPLPKPTNAMPSMGEVVKHVMASAHLMTETRQNILPGMLALNAPTISPPPAPTRALKRSAVMADPNCQTKKKSVLPRAVQMEIATLSQRFKISIDSSQPTDKGGTTLLCSYRNQNISRNCDTLSVRIPSNYPHNEPAFTVNLTGTTNKTADIENTIKKNLMRLPHRVTFTMILIAWEQKLREGYMK